MLILCALLPAGLNQIRSLPSIVDAVGYPAYWYRTQAYLASAVPEDEPVVVLPWHLYQPLVASEGRLVANPAHVFFPGISWCRGTSRSRAGSPTSPHATTGSGR